jgi:hypothetical protein
MIKSGRVLFCDTLDGILGNHCRLTLRLDESRAKPPVITSALSWEDGGREWTAVCSASADDVRIEAAKAGAEVVEESPLNLDEIFVAYAGGKRPEGTDQ